MKNDHSYAFNAACIAATLFFSAQGWASGLVAKAPKYGRLKVTGTQLTDATGKAVQLKGMSTFGLQWYPAIVDPDSFKALAQDWGCDVVRLAMYVGENGYATHPEVKAVVEKGIQLAIAQGMYVIIDWHVLTPGNPNDPVYSGAEAFFKDMATKYGAYPHVIYEIMNEPNGLLSWAKDLKPYAQRIVKAIRSKDADNLILIGSGTWSQDVDTAAADTVSGKNLMYSFHFYSGSHGPEQRDKVQKAIDSGVGIFVTEWGTSQASGTGGPYINNSEEWLRFLDEKKISWVNWSLSNKNETSAAFKSLLQDYQGDKGNVVVQKETPLVPAVPGPDGIKVWTQDQLSVSGAYLRAKMKGIAVPTYPQPLVSWDFEDGTTQKWAVADDSAVKPELKPGKAETSAVGFIGKWATEVIPDGWSTAPRLKISGIGIDLSSAASLSAEFYLEAGKKVGKEFEVNPVLQYPPSWWNQLPSVKVSYSEGAPVAGGLLKYNVKIPIAVAAGTKLEHLLFVVNGNGTGYEGKVLFDNIAINGMTNGDMSNRVVSVVKDDPGAFKNLPWDFEDGSRQGWFVPDDSAAKVKLSVAKVETNAMVFSYGWKTPGPDDPWNAAPRISSSFSELVASKYSKVAIDFYVEAGKATKGSLQVQPVVQSPQHGYWFQLAPVDIDFAKGTPVAGGWLKYSIQVPLKNASGTLIHTDAVLRNLILVILGNKTDYQGQIAVDNMTYSL